MAFIPIRDAAKLVDRHLIYAWIENGKLARQDDLVNKDQLDELLEEHVPSRLWFSSKQYDLLRLVFETCSNNWETCDYCKHAESCKMLWERIVDKSNLGS